jgi:hypothetical protein
MDSELTERTAAILDSASTWDGVVRVRTRSDGRVRTTLRVGGRAFGRAEDGSVAARFPGKLPRVVVRHGLADAETGDGWTRLSEPSVAAATESLWLAYLSRVARMGRQRPADAPDVDIDAGLDELDLSPGVVHLVREQGRA